MKVRPPQFIYSTFKASVFILLFWFGGAHPSYGQCTLGCLPGPIEIAIGSNGYSPLLPEYFIAFESQECQGPNSVIVVETGSDTVDCSMVAGLYTVRVENEASGNFCTTSIRVVDNIEPTIQCPSSVTLHCDQDYLDMGLTGQPVVVENCEADIRHTDDINGLNDCGLGEVKRTWRVEDPSGFTARCIQTIEIADTVPPQIQFPADITIQCNQDPLDLALTGRPVYSDNCGSLDDGFTDLSFKLCSPGTKRILRNWSVVDFCNANGPYGQYAYAQTIVVQDTVKPEFVCRGKDSIETDPLSALGTYEVLPPDSLADNCSGVLYDFQVFTAKGDTLPGDSNQVILPLGQNTIRHFIQDSCGNADSCDQIITVFDDEDPQVVCFPSVQFSLGGESLIIYPKQLYRDASDNTTSDSLLIVDIRRDSVWRDSLLFDCSDVNHSDIFVQVRITDAFGNFNLCDVQILLNDISVPTITCPPNLTLDCLEPLDTLGVPQVWDNCNLDLSHEDDFSGLNVCGFGSVYRTWRVEDASGNIDSCIQLIDIVFSGQPQFTVPADVTMACGQSISPDITGEPQFVDDCSRLIFAYEDRSFSGGPEYVEIIRRTFEIGDLCRPGYTEEFIQRIFIEDTGSPTLDCQAENAYYLYHDSCDILVQIPLGISDNCSSSFQFSHNSPKGDIVDNQFIAELDMGSYDIFVEVSDESGNTDQCHLIFEVLDTIAPAPVCRTGLSLPIPESGVLEPPAQLFDLGSSDNCTPENALELELIPAQFDCFDRGANALQLIVRDASGNETVCQSEIFVTDPNEFCPPIEHELAGMVLDAHQYYPLSDQALRVVVDGDSSVVRTDSTGWYRLSGVPHGAAISINPISGGSLKFGLSTSDIVLLQSHLLERRKFNSPAEFLAADVNESGEVSNLDALFMRRAILQTVAGFPGSDLLRSMNYELELTEASQALQLRDDQEMILLDSIYENNQNLHFFVSKKGDVNGSYADDFLVNARGSACDSSFIIKGQKAKMNSGEKGTLFLVSNRSIDLAGLQFGIVFDPYDMEFFEFGTRGRINLSSSDFNNIHEEGRILLSWSAMEQIPIEPGDTLVELIFQPKRQMDWPGSLQLSKAFTAEVVTGDLDIYDICTDFDLAVKNKEQFTSEWKALPNPFDDVLELHIDGFINGEGDIIIWDLLGREMLSRKFGAVNTLFIKTSHWPKGVYWLNYRTEGDMGVLKLIKS